MSRVVHRVALPISRFKPTSLPKEAKFLHVAPSRSNPNYDIDLWYEIGSDASLQLADLKHYKIYIYGTGHSIPDESEYIGTAVNPDGLVWHVYLDLGKG